MNRIIIVDYGNQTTYDEFGRLRPPINRYVLWHGTSGFDPIGSNDVGYLKDKYKDYNPEVVTLKNWRRRLKELWICSTQCPEFGCPLLIATKKDEGSNINIKCEINEVE